MLPFLLSLGSPFSTVSETASLWRQDILLTLFWLTGMSDFQSHQSACSNEKLLEQHYWQITDELFYMHLIGLVEELINLFCVQIQRWRGPHRWTSRWWEGTGSTQSYCIRVLRSLQGLCFQALWFQGEERNAPHEAHQAAACPRQPADDEVPHQRVLVPQPAHPQESPRPKNQPHISESDYSSQEVKYSAIKQQVFWLSK